MTGHNRKFLIFSLQGTFYGLDLKQVAEVLDPPQTWPIPLAPPCYSGAMNFHGDIIAVMNLQLFFGLSVSTPPEKVIVLHQEVASLAFLVDTVVNIISEDELSIMPPPPVNPFAAAMLALPDGEAILLDLGELVRNAEIGMQRKITGAIFTST